MIFVILEYHKAANAYMHPFAGLLLSARHRCDFERETSMAMAAML